MKLRKSQRIMSLFLSLLMLLSTFAGSGFTVRAAEPTEVEAEDLDETSAAPTEVEGEDIDPDAFKNEITIKLGDVYTSITNAGKKATLWNYGNTQTQIGTASADVDISADPDNGYSFVISPDKGYALKDSGNLIEEVSYKVVTYDAETETTNTPIVRHETSGWTVSKVDADKEPGYVRDSYVVTFTPDLLKKVRAGIYYTDKVGITKAAGTAELSVTWKSGSDYTAYATEQSVQIQPKPIHWTTTAM